MRADTASSHSNVSDRCYPAVPGEGWRKVEVLPHANCARFHPPFTRSYIPRPRGWKWETLEISGREYLPPLVRWKESERERVREKRFEENGKYRGRRRQKERKTSEGRERERKNSSRKQFLRDSEKRLPNGWRSGART